MREVKVENHLRAEVAKCGGQAEKHVSPGRRGVPDELVTWPDGVMDLVETKRPDGDLKAWQLRDHEIRRRLNVKVWTCYTREDVDAYIVARRAHWNLGLTQH